MESKEYTSLLEYYQLNGQTLWTTQSVEPGTGSGCIARLGPTLCTEQRVERETGCIARFGPTLCAEQRVERGVCCIARLAVLTLPCD